MKTLQSLKKRHKLLSSIMIVVVIITAFFVMYFVGNGFSLNDTIFGTNNDVRVMLSSPNEGALFYEGESIHIAGSVWGGIPKIVYVWDERYNVPVVCTLSASTFGVMLYASDLSAGRHTLCVQAQTDDGRWSDIEIVNIEKHGSQAYSGWVTQANTWVEAYLPQPLGIVFRPVEEVLSQIVVYVTGGTSDDDLNGDNIPDGVQQAPTTPRYNPMNVPMSGMIIFSLFILVIIIILLYIVHPYINRKQQLKREMINDPGKRAWLLQIEALRNKKLRQQLKAEKEKNKALAEKTKLGQNKDKRPIKIYLSPKKKKEESQDQKSIRWR